jgi:hypothetical protein
MTGIGAAIVGTGFIDRANEVLLRNPSLLDPERWIEVQR